MSDVRLKKLLKGIRKALVTNIPEAVRALRIKSPAYCLFIWYQDLSTDEYAPILGVAPVELRDACLSGKYGEKIGNEPTVSIWLPQQSIDTPFPGFPIPTHVCENLSAESNECYSIMTADEPSGDREEDSLLMPFRTALHKVARELNGYDWSDTLPYTDDFVVLAADYIGCWIIEDMPASIPNKKLTALKKRGLIPTEWVGRDLNAEKAAYEAQLLAEKQARQAVFLEELRVLEQARDKEMLCPRCGFSFGWTGIECSHCKFGIT